MAAEILTDFPERLSQLKTAELWDGRTPPRLVAVRSCWLSPSHGGQAIFRFEGSDSIDDAALLVGLEVQIPLADRMPLPHGLYYVTDLIGCEVWELGAGLLGQVRDVQTTGEQALGTPVLEVDGSSGGFLIPLAEEICVRIDTSAHRIEVRLPEGLRELNRNS